MNQFLIFLFAVLLLNLPVSNQSHNKNHFTPVECKSNFKPESTAPPGFQQLLSSNIKKDGNKFENDFSEKSWFDKAMSNIRSEEYNISYSEELRSYQSPNRANNIRFIYHSDGFTAKTRESKFPLFDLNDKIIPEKEKKYKVIPEWSIRFKTSGMKREPDGKARVRDDSSIEFAGSEVRVNKNQASVEDDNMRIDYINTEKGMRQDFLIKNKPDGEGKLELELSAETSLRMIVKKDVLSFKDKTGNEKLKYSSLKVWDANGRELAACFKANYESPVSREVRSTNGKIEKISPKSNYSNPKSFSIVVNDENAIYPITIDPLSTSPDWIAEGNQVDAAFGYSVSTAGDVNNDGFSDVIVGAFLYDNGHTDEGRAFVYYGSILGLSPVAAWTAEGNQANAQFGYSVSSAGDVNNDGYSDVIIGANIYDNDETDEGRVFAYYGSNLGLSPIPNWTAESNQGGSQFGLTVSSAGDVNNDGYSDVIVGAPLYDNGMSDEGRAFVYYGSLSGLSFTANWTGESNQETALFGYSVASAGDINGDGYSDIIVGAITYDTPVWNEGIAFVYYGSAAGISPVANWIPASSFQAFFVNFGVSVSTAGDVNNDGYSDVIVGAYTFDNGEIDEGRVFAYYGSASGLPTIANWTAESDQPYARFGYSVSTAGDVNNDGYSDVIVGSHFYDNGQTDEGKVFVYYGSSSGLSSTANWTAESNQANSLFGNSVSTAGDVNGDGYSDVIVGSYLYDNGQANEGGAFVYYGSASNLQVLTLSMFIQGFYNNVSNLMVQDTIRVYLRNTFSPYAIVDSATAVTTLLGVAILNFANASNGVNYYLQIRHRNSVETWSSRGIRFTGGVMNYNFSIASTQAFGNNMIPVDNSPLAFALYGGDINQDGFINLNDITMAYNNSFYFVNGYVATDLNGDNITNLSDILIAYDNSNTFVIVMHP